MSAERYAAILAGGSGTRLWPLSRAARPKQLLPLVGPASLLRNTFERIRPLVPPERIFILTERSHAAEIRAELPEIPAENVLVEPTRRGTAGSLALPALLIHQRSPLSVWASLHSDHLIADDELFRQNLNAAFTAAERQPYLLTMGIVPTFPSTQLGYVQHAEALDQVDFFPIYRVRQFVEKPDEDTARQFLASGEYFWNAGIFVWSAENIRREFERLLPDLYGPLSSVAASFGRPEFQSVYERVYPTIPVETIDRGIMEKASHVAVVPARFGWVDVGSWKELYEALRSESNPDGNVVRGEHLGLDTHRCLVYGGKRLVATVGLEDLVVVETDDVLLIARRDRATEVRTLVEQLERQGRHELL